MNLTRRDFGKGIGTAALALSVAGTSSLLSGCNVISDIEGWIPVAQASVSSIETILTSNGVNIAPVKVILDDIQAGLAAVLGAAQQYAATNPPPVGALQKIQAAFQAVVANFGQFLQTLNLPGGGLLNLIAALAGLVLSTIAGFMNRLPAAPPAASVASFSVKGPNGVFLTVVPKSRSKRAFKKDWNGQLDSAAKTVTVPKATYQPVSFFERL